MGILYIYDYMQPRWYASVGFSYNTVMSYHSISLSLNVLLTLMIIVRLVLHSRNVRNAIGAHAGATGLYTAVVTMLIESYALYAIAYLLYIALATTSSPFLYVLNPIIAATQVCVASTFFWHRKLSDNSENIDHRSVPDSPQSRRQKSVDS